MTKKQQASHDAGYEMGFSQGLQIGKLAEAARLKEDRRQLDADRKRFRATVSGSRHIARALHDLLDNAGCD